MYRTVIIIFLVISSINFSSGAIKRCYSCRSRGDLGSCKDPFTYNSSAESGIEIVPCASGWCSKMIEGKEGDYYGVATARQCLAKGPSDSEERCDNTEWYQRKVFMCFCKGDLCNSATSLLWDVPLAVLCLIPIVGFYLTT